MDKQEIIQKFLERARLLTPDALSFLEKGKNTEDFLERKYTSLVVTETDLAVDNIKIIKKLGTMPEEVTTEDFIQFYRSKYEKMRDIIISRFKKEFVSLNNLSKGKEVFVIGIVKEIKDREGKKMIELEDLTTTANVLMGGVAGLELDDVVGIRAIMGQKVLFGKQIMYPDVPLRSPTICKGKACFISDLHLNEAPPKDAERFFSWFEKQNIKYLFIAGDIGDTKLLQKLIELHCYEKKVFIIPGNADGDKYPQLPLRLKTKNTYALSNPAMVEVNGIKVLMIHSFSSEMLKKRYLGKSDIPLREDYLVLEEVPDIVHCGHTHEFRVVNHKAVTIVNSGSLLADFRPIVIDFATREAQEVDFKKIV